MIIGTNIGSFLSVFVERIGGIGGGKNRVGDAGFEKCWLSIVGGINGVAISTCCDNWLSSVLLGGAPLPAVLLLSWSARKHGNNKCSLSFKSRRHSLKEN